MQFLIPSLQRKRLELEAVLNHKGHAPLLLCSLRTSFLINGFLGSYCGAAAMSAQASESVRLWSLTHLIQRQLW